MKTGRMPRRFPRSLFYLLALSTAPASCTGAQSHARRHMSPAETGSLRIEGAGFGVRSFVRGTANWRMT